MTVSELIASGGIRVGPREGYCSKLCLLDGIDIGDPKDCTPGLRAKAAVGIRRCREAFAKYTGEEPKPIQDDGPGPAYVLPDGNRFTGD